MIAILILNWNSYEDTIECIDSLQKVKDTDFFIVVGDNGSTNDSITQIRNHCELANLNIQYFDDNEIQIQNPANRELFLVNLKSNHGFAKGNNLMVDMVRNAPIDYVLLLNNDTTVDPKFLSSLVNFRNSNHQYEVLTPLIRLHSRPDVVWNAGGDIRFGIRRYNYPYKPLCEIKEENKIDITFITGCALFASKKIINNEKPFLTERFFFGEEDIEFSIRQKRKGIKMACVLDSTIYHKVGASSTETKRFPTVNYVNRLVNMQNLLPKYKYAVFKMIFHLQVLRIMRRNYGWNAFKSFKYAKSMIKFASQREAVNYDDFKLLSKITPDDICRLH